MIWHLQLEVTLSQVSYMKNDFLGTRLARTLHYVEFFVKKGSFWTSES